MYLLDVLIAVLTFVTFQGVLAEKRGESCLTPNDESAKCIPVLSCDVIVKALATRNSSAIDFARKSQCGYDTDPLVCCGTAAYLIPPGTTLNKPSSIFFDTTNDGRVDTTQCGVEKHSIRVEGAELTEFDEFPWMVALEYQIEKTGASAGIKCGGSLINTKYVLTAAHCIITNELKVFRAWLGEWKISIDPDCSTYIAALECADPVQKIIVENQIPHPNFNKVNGTNDIGLLCLELEVQYTDYIRPICLPTANLPNPEVHALMTVAGWGITEDGRESDYKLKVEVPLLTNEACNAKLHVPLTPNQYCAGGEFGKGSCRGDSGGPVMRAYQQKPTDQRQWYLEGVISHGLGCGREGYPAVYTRVSEYMSWILKTISLD